MKKFLLAIAIFFIACNNNTETSQDTEENSVILKQAVSVKPVKSGKISHLLFSTGTIEAEEAVEIYPKISGYVHNVYKDQGDIVTKETPLMKLDDLEWQMKVSEANLEISTFPQKRKQAELNIRSLEKQLIQAELNIQELQDTMEQIELNLKQAKSDHKRDTGRYQKQLISLDVYQQTKYSYEKALLEQKANLVKLQKARVSREDTALSLEKSKLELKTLETDLSRAKFALDRAKLELSYTKIFPPFEGIISQRDVNRGQLVSSQSKVFSIVNLNKLIVRLNISEKDLLLLKKQQTVILENDNFPGMKELGTVRHISPVVDSESGTIQVTVDITSEKHKLLRPGIFVRASIEVKSNPQAILVPRKAIVYERDKKVVFVIEDDIAEKRIVEVGIQSVNVIEVISGVSEGEKIVVKGQHLLQDSQPVKVIGQKKNKKKNKENREKRKRNRQKKQKETKDL